MTRRSHLVQVTYQGYSVTKKRARHVPVLVDHRLVDIAGGDKVRQAILIGTPNYGSASALQQAIMGEKVGFGRIQPETMATMPGMYHLLPEICDLFEQYPIG